MMAEERPQAGDWPDVDPFPGRVADALRASLASFNPAPEAVERWAGRIYVHARLGREAERPNNRPASVAQTEAQLRDLHRLAGDLAGLIDAMGRPALWALEREGLNAAALAQALREAQEIARHAFADFEAGPSTGGRPPKIEAASVTREAARAFEEITGRRASFTVDPLTSELTGIWPATLEAIFAALGIDASVSAQVRKLHADTARP